MGTDSWLDRRMPRLRRAAGAGPVLAIGCGPGAGTQTLTKGRMLVAAFDLSPESVAKAWLAASAAGVSVRSLLNPLPLTGLLHARLAGDLRRGIDRPRAAVDEAAQATRIRAAAEFVAAARRRQLGPVTRKPTHG